MNATLPPEVRAAIEAGPRWDETYGEFITRIARIAAEKCVGIIQANAVNVNANGWPKQLIPDSRGELDAVRATYASAIRAAFGIGGERP